MATGWAGGPLMDIGSKAFAERMDQLSGGRFKIQVFPGGALGNALKVPETVKNGVAECGHTWMGYDWGKDPTTVLFGGYAGSIDTERMLHWLYERRRREMQRQFRDGKGRHRFVRAVHPHRRGLPALAQAGQDARRPEGPEAAHRGRLARNGQGPRRGAGHHRRRRRLSDARARRDRRHRVGHAVREHLAWLPQGRQVRDLSPACTSPPRRSSWCINKEAWAKVTPADSGWSRGGQAGDLRDAGSRSASRTPRRWSSTRRPATRSSSSTSKCSAQARKIGLDWAAKTAKDNPVVRQGAAEPAGVREGMAGRGTLADHQELIPVARQERGESRDRRVFSAAAAQAITTGSREARWMQWFAPSSARAEQWGYSAHA